MGSLEITHFSPEGIRNDLLALLLTMSLALHPLWRFLGIDSIGLKLLPLQLIHFAEGRSKGLNEILPFLLLSELQNSGKEDLVLAPSESGCEQHLELVQHFQHLLASRHRAEASKEIRGICLLTQIEDDQFCSNLHLSMIEKLAWVLGQLIQVM